MKKILLIIFPLISVSYSASGKPQEENPFWSKREILQRDHYQESTVTEPQEQNDFKNQKRKIEGNINYEEEKQQPIKAKLERLSDKKKKDKK